MPQTKLANQFRTCRETTLPQNIAFLSVQTDRNFRIANRYENRSRAQFALLSLFDMFYTGRLGGIAQRFSALPVTPSVLTGRFSAFQFDRYAKFTNQWDANFLSVLRCVISLDSVNIRLYKPMRLPVSFEANGKWLASATLRRDAINTAARLLLAAKLDSTTTRLQKIAEKFSAQNFSPILKTTGKCNYLLLYRLRTLNRLDAVDEFGEYRFFKIPVRFDERFEAIYRQCTLFGPGWAERLAASAFRFGSLKNFFARQNVHCFSLVKPGWRIVATDIVTGEEIEVGFIDEDEHEIAGVALPDGDYEISVLTSSLFWTDTRDTNARLIKLAGDEELSPLPVIYNLRTSVSNGERTLYWSANNSEMDDCVFGVWFSENTPVDIDRPADKTVWYSPEMTEYSVTFSQNTPCFAAVAAIRTGDNPETGKAHELFLDWRSIPPRQPDDTIIWETKHD